MIKRLLIFMAIAIIASANLQAQTKVSGVIKDKETGETLIGANVLFAPGVGAITDFEGNFKSELKNGDYELQVSYVGYKTITQKLKAEGKSVTLIFDMESSKMIDEVKITADIARARQTPVAFTNVMTAKIEEKIAGQEIPMLLNQTPGVYATQMGGGDGDARITIRGFDARNVGVMLDGVPVNDMENGTVYWSNWFGLESVTRTIQVQRGLGASKLALPSVGGTINILTKGIDEKKFAYLRQEVNNDGMYQTSMGYNSGRLANGWGVTLAATYKKGNGWVDKSWSEAYFGYLKVEKRFKNQLFSFSAYGAPQKHAQRSYNLPAAVYDLEWAKKHGLDTADLKNYKPTNYVTGKFGFDRGLRYNQHWGTIDKDSITNYKDRTLPTYVANRVNLTDPYNQNERINIYSKPQFTLKHSWAINSQMNLTTIGYLSVGSGGGVRERATIPFLADGTKDMQTMYDVNRNTPIGLFDKPYSSTLRKSSNFLVNAKNDHLWYGALSTLNYQMNQNITMTGGLDYRDYRGSHYWEIYDLMGGDYVNNQDDQSISYKNPDGSKNYKAQMKYKGDKINYYNDGLVRWIGGVYLVEYKKGPVSAFFNLTASKTAYKRVDLFKVDSLQETAWKNIWGYTTKAGANYNITGDLNLFMNLGYLDKAPRFKNVFDNNNLLYKEINNEKIKAIELGSNYATPKFTANLNLYYTQWENRPVETATTVYWTDALGQSYTASANVNGLGAIHKGLELDFAWIIHRKLQFQGLVSLGDWTWNSGDTVRVVDDRGKVLATKYVYAKGLHVGNAAQTQVSGELRFEPIKGLYLTSTATFFGKYYANFDPTGYDPSSNPGNFDANGNPVDPWRIPNFYLIDLRAGYNFMVAKKFRIQLRGSLLNAFNMIYISDADDNSKNIGQNWNSHDLRSAAVFFGLGRRFNLSATINF